MLPHLPSVYCIFCFIMNVLSSFSLTFLLPYSMPAALKASILHDLHYLSSTVRNLWTHTQRFFCLLHLLIPCNSSNAFTHSLDCSPLSFNLCNPPITSYSLRFSSSISKMFRFLNHCCYIPAEIIVIRHKWKGA